MICTQHSVKLSAELNTNALVVDSISAFVYMF